MVPLICLSSFNNRRLYLREQSLLIWHLINTITFSVSGRNERTWNIMELFFQCRLRLKVVGTFFSSSRGPTILEKNITAYNLCWIERVLLQLQQSSVVIMTIAKRLFLSLLSLLLTNKIDFVETNFWHSHKIQHFRFKWPRNVRKSRSTLMHLALHVYGREPWSSGYGRRLMFQWSSVQIPAPYTGWTFFHI